ncbi:DUF3370 domain-containing protein [Oscillatoria sp. FACHB-1406]|uniref:DUF3370 domain-containing protein n=1 Tax=Oscillatoria sp. FACHB-1406 TaxID=2692846 RepID=UPI001685D1E0|nr:DUF3370 domain-containing protein [Oscillatoria sp. FACHB-1406]MBD2579880.1 DUF3370 domain-containing protein [Oscillatoria sp. FACHB-1406]
MKVKFITLFLLGFLVVFVPACLDRIPFAQRKLSAAEPQEIVRNNEVRSLPGKLDSIPMFNSNSPEWVKTEGILLSTFPPTGKRVPAAHLNYPFNGDFTLFAHHFTHTPPNLQTLYLGILVHNPGEQPVTLSIPAAASYLLEPDAPFQQKPPMSENPDGAIFSGPGIRAVDSVMRGKRQADFPEKILIPPRQSRMLMNLPIPVRGLEKPVNGRSSFLRLNGSDTVYMASLAMYAKKTPEGTERAPTLAEWQQLLDTGNLAGPRDKTPTPPTQTSGQLIYGRVAGVQLGSTWQATITDSDTDILPLPAPDRAISYAIDTLRGGELSTYPIQAAPLAVRYPDTAYESHANYAVNYDLTLPLANINDYYGVRRARTVELTLETPLKEGRLSRGGLIFRQPSWDFPFFRGTVRLRYKDDSGQEVTRYVHLWHRRGQVLEPLVSLTLQPQERRTVRLDFLYPPDSVPPQVLTVSAK